jgi:molecular chaperone DnaK
VLVDITPHTLGIGCLGELYGVLSDRLFSPIINRNTPLPATRSEIYYTASKGQEKAQIRVYQGENEDSTYNESVGNFTLEGLNEDAPAGSEILVRFDLNLDGILTVTAIERETGREKKLTIDNVITQFRAKSRQEAKERLVAMFGQQPAVGTSSESEPGAPRASGGEPDLDGETSQLVAKARRLATQAASADAEEMHELIEELQRAIAASDESRIQEIQEKLEDLVFYLEDA